MSRRPSSYGRGIARKAAYTKKCSCDNPKWSREHIEVNGNTAEITYVLSCSNCKAYWATKSLSARKFWEKYMDEVPGLWMGFTYNGNQTVRELFHEHDMDRLAHLEMVARNRDTIAREAQEEAEKAHRAVEKFKREMQENEGLSVRELPGYADSTAAQKSDDDWEGMFSGGSFLSANKMER